MTDNLSKSNKSPFANGRRVLVITGSTASGKSDISERLVAKLSGEIVSADSCQVYKHLDIGTAKPSDPPCPYHLIDFLDVNERYDANSFKADAEKTIEAVFDRGNLPVVVGGTGFYVRALTEGIFKGNYRCNKTRETLKRKHENGFDLFKELQAVDPVAASKIHPNNLVRIIRYLEVYHISGKPISWHWENAELEKPRYSYLKIAIRLSREYLRKRIRTRVDKMLTAGWIDEVRSLLENGVTADAPAMESVGYREIINYLQKRISFEQLNDALFHQTWQYSRRQMIWLRKEPNLLWLDLDEDYGIEESAGQLLRKYNDYCQKSQN